MVKETKTRRTIKRNKENCLTVIGINCNGLSGKRDSLVANIEVLKTLSLLCSRNKVYEERIIQSEQF